MATAKAERFSDAVLDSYQVFGDVAQSANERSIKLARKLASDVTKNQQEAMELGKMLIEAPTDVAPYLSSAIEALARAQNRAIDFAQSVFDETLSFNSEAIDRTYKANRAVAETAISGVRNLVEGSPVVEAVGDRVRSYAPKSNGRSRKTTAATN
ncbi:MAG TPA: hypothetical protein VFZ12_05570 [Dehalococcoidia bacterium]|nr:hypothetical protein [Dehalococcoidia bacterium]